MVILAACFKQQDAVTPTFREPTRHDASSGAGAYYNKVELQFFRAHAFRLTPLPKSLR